jgi:hypothetical protein
MGVNLSTARWIDHVACMRMLIRKYERKRKEDRVEGYYLLDISGAG